MSRHIHFVIPDLFLPNELAPKACAGLHLPALEKILGRARTKNLSAGTLESWLCEAFGVEGEAVAPVTLRADGVEPGTSYWLRADPVHLRIQHDQLVLQPGVSLNADEAAQLCASLNEHFAHDGLRFVAPRPQRWYLQLEKAPQISTFSLAQVSGRDIHSYLPHGADALRWHGIFNEIQMLLYNHVLNQAREMKDEWMVNSVWLWGGGYAAKLWQPFKQILTDSSLVAAFAETAEIGHMALPEDEAQCVSRCVMGLDGDLLVVWDGLRIALQHGDLGGWRDSLQRFERICAHPLFQALRSGRIEKITLDVLQENASRRFVLTRQAIWKFWQRKRLSGFALV